MSDGGVESLIPGSRQTEIPGSREAAESRGMSPKARPVGGLTLAGSALAMVVAVALLIPALALLGLGVLFDRTINGGAAPSMERMRSWVHSQVRQSLREDPQARGADLTDAIRRGLGRGDGVYVFRSANSGPDQGELLVSLLDPQSLNEFIGHDWVACIQVDVTTGDVATITSTGLNCPADAVYTHGVQEEHSTPGLPGTPIDAYVVHLPPLREQV